MLARLGVGTEAVAGRKKFSILPNYVETSASCRPTPRIERERERGLIAFSGRNGVLSQREVFPLP